MTSEKKELRSFSITNKHRLFGTMYEIDDLCTILYVLSTLYYIL